MARMIIRFSGKVVSARKMCSKCYRMVDDSEIYSNGGYCNRCKWGY